MAELRLFEARDDRRVVPDAVLDQAIHWVTVLQSGQAGNSEHEACQRWRASHADHELAWQRLAGLCGDVQQGGGVAPPPLARQLLASAARTRSRRTAVKWMLGALGTGALAWGGATRFDVSMTMLVADFRTGTGERRNVTLPDGSQLVMNTGSALDVVFDDTQRVVLLHRGEIHLETAVDASGRPLVVRIGHLEAQPLGTRFAVRRFDAQDVCIAVREGAVALRDDQLTGSRVVQAGMQGGIASHGWRDSRPMADISDSWVSGALVVERMALAEFAQELGRYRPGLLRCDPAVAALQVSGSFPLANTDAALAALTAILPVKVQRRTPYWVTLTEA